jgi:hypothetical protein
MSWHVLCTKWLKRSYRPGSWPARNVKGEKVMKKNARIRYTIFAVFFIAVLVVSSVFTGDVLAETKSIIRLSVINSSQYHFYLYLYGGGEEYTIKVPAYTSDKIFIKPGEYSYYMEACNYSKYGKMDLSVFQTIHVPVCGGRASEMRTKFHHIDVSTIMKPVRVKIRNKTGDDVGLYLRTMEDHKFLNLSPGEVLEVILKKEEGIQYVYSFQACGGKLITGYYTPMVRWPLDLKCPKE